MFAQSIGGGGYGGASVLQGWTLPVLGGAGGSSGQGGYIEVRTLTGSTTIRTTGAKAHGVFAQSLGGGGGTVSDALKTDDTARAALEKTATVLAGLIGKAGGSGTVLDNKGTGGDISIKLAGDIRTSGAGSYGIFAQSGFQQSSGALDASRAGGSIAVDYSGTLQGGSGEGAGIVIDGGRNNTIVIGAGSRVGALSDRAIVSTFGQESVRNFGTVVGDIDLARGNTTEWNEFRNEVGGTYVSGGSGTIKVGNGNGWFYNAGTFDVGGMGRIATATVQKVDLQLDGTLLVDVNSVAAGGPKADLVQASQVLVEGVKIKPHAVEGLLPGSFTVVSASSLQTGRAATAAGGPGSPIAWSASQSGGGISISPSADFVGKAQGNLTDTDRSLLDSLQRAWDGNEAGMAGIFASMANIESAQQYETAIGSMTPTEDLGQLASDQTLAGRKSLNAALSCPVFDGAGVTLRETQCVWSRITGSRTTQDRGSASDGYSQDGLSYRIGGQWEIRPDWFFGATAAYNVSSMHTRDSLTSVHGRSGDVSVSLKHQTGPWLLAGALHAGYGDYDSSSLFWVGDDLWSAENKNDVWTAGLRLRAAYELASDDWYLRPYADLDVLHTYMPGYTLAGDGATLQAGAMKEWSVAVSPTLEAGTRVDLGRYGWLRPYVSVGATFINNRSLDSDVSFSDGSGKGITFTSSSSLPERLFNVGAGVQLYAQDKYELRAEYRAQLASEFRNQELSLRVAMRF
ncbi:autotransporter domain-containing protein [Castellaniella defragrans]|uniref:autotransporter outer membrane beta-barrel domain-containing protein n=1 Tax=Castellaniella defragrans TaxID=75697 RepID=UPI002AFE889F|nr:autotransporter domain-containing protein [Castellaniella defragrans]